MTESQCEQFVDSVKFVGVSRCLQRLKSDIQYTY